MKKKKVKSSRKKIEKPDRKIRINKKQLKTIISKLSQQTINNSKNSEQSKAVEENLEEITKKKTKQIKNEQFQNFMEMPSFNFHAPILESENHQQEIRLEDTAGETGREEKKEEPIQYERGYTHTDDYETTEKIAREMNRDIIVRTAPVLRPENRVFEMRPQIERDFQINPELQEARKHSQRNLERDYIAKAGSLNKGEKLPFEQKERKYQGKSV